MPSSNCLELGNRESAVIVAVAIVRMVQMSFHKIVRMITVRYGLMSAICSMSVIFFMTAAFMLWSAGCRIRRIYI
jgi:hypothetical protein